MGLFPGDPGMVKTMTDALRDQHLRQNLDHYEGFEPRPYPDAKGTTSIGLGTQRNAITNAGLRELGLDPTKVWAGQQPLSRQQAAKLRDGAIRDVETKIKGRFTDWDNMPVAKRNALVMMGYQMGPGFVDKFPSMVKAVNREDWLTAQKEALYQVGDPEKPGYMKEKSDWHKQTPRRAKETADLFIHNPFVPRPQHPVPAHTLKK
jgi:GH24 family phage-related lysozyme (muramidase)